MKKFLQNFKTSTPGIIAIITGISLLISKQIPEGVAAIMSGIGLVGAKDHDQK